MKSFIVSIIIFSILILLVTANSIYVHSVCNKMLRISNSLQIEDIDAANELCRFWQKNRMIFSISIHDTHLERITELTENIKSAVNTGDGAEFSKNIILLSELLDALKKNEEISFQGII